MKEKAAELVKKLLARRLENAGMRTSRPDNLVQCEAADPQAYPGGTEVKVNIWRQWSEASVKLDWDTGEFLGYSVNRYSDPPARAELTREQALTLAAGALNIPEGAVLATFRQYEYAPQYGVVELMWNRVHQGMKVDGDYMRVVLHPITGRIVEMERFWREIRLPVR
jgi:hypothetical protein